MSNKRSNISNNPGNSKDVTSNSSPSTSKQQTNKTQVFILRPEILKKLGISAHIPNLQSFTTNANSGNNITTSKKQTITNTTDISTGETVHETEDNQKKENKPTEKTVTRNSKPMVNLAKVSGRGKKKQIQSDKEENPIETDVKGKPVEKESEQEELSIIEDMAKSKINNQTSVEEKSNITNLLKSKLSKIIMNSKGQDLGNDNESKIQDTLPKISGIKRPFKNVRIVRKLAEEEISVEKQENDCKNKTNDTILPVSSMKQQLLKSKSEDSVKKGQTTTPKQNLMENSEPEENTAISNTDKETDVTPIRKSGRKRKLSNLHDDFVTDLKLHDGTETNRKKVVKTRKSMDSTMINSQENISSKDAEDLKSKQQIGRKKHTEEVKVLDKPEIDNTIVDTKSKVVKTYSRSKKLSQSNIESNVNLQKGKTSDAIKLNDNNSESDTNYCVITNDISIEMKDTNQEMHTEPLSIENAKSIMISDPKPQLDISHTTDPKGKISKRKIMSIDDSGIKRCNAIKEPSKNKIKILDIQTFNQVEQIKTQLLNKVRTIPGNSNDAVISENTTEVITKSEMAQLSYLATESAKDSVSEKPTKISKSFTNNSIEISNQQLSLTDVSRECNDVNKVTKISSIPESSGELLKDKEKSNKNVSKNELKETDDAVFIEEISNRNKLNEEIDNLEHQDIMIETKLYDTLEEKIDKTVKNINVVEKAITIIPREDSENSKLKEDSLNEATDNLNKHEILNHTVHNVKDTPIKSVDETSGKIQIVEKAITEVDSNSETIKSRGKFSKSNQPTDTMISNNAETSKSKVPTEPDVKAEVDTAEVPQESFSAESSMTTSTPNVKRRRGRPRKSNKTLGNSNIENNNSHSIVCEPEKNLITTCESTAPFNSTLQKSILSETIASEVSEIKMETPVKKRPGRPKKKPFVQDDITMKTSTSIIEENDMTTSVSVLQSTAQDSLDEDEPLVKRKVGRPRKLKEETTDDEEEDEPAGADESKISENKESVTKSKRTWRRGRKKKSAVEDEDVEKKKPIISADGLVKCALCKIEVKNSSWANHCAKHNFLTWRVGEEEIDLQNRTVVSSILYRAVKGRKHVFTCETCGDKKKSVVGYLSHLDQCQKTKEEIENMRVACTICNRLMQPISLKVHMAVHNDKVKPESTFDDVPVDIKHKRQAAKKAVGLIQEVSQDENNKPVRKTCRKAYKKFTDLTKLQLYGGLNQSLKSEIGKSGTVRCKIKKCAFETKNFDELKTHFNSCPELKENDIVCCYCLLVLDNEAEMIQHVKKNHYKSREEDSDHVNEDIDEDDDDDEFVVDEDEVVEKRSRTVLTVSQRKYTYKIDFLAKEKRMLPSLVITYPATMNWTMDFVRENYADKQLFSTYKTLMSHWKLLTEETYKDYMPELSKSMCVEQVVIKHTIPCLQGKEYSWKEYELFETDIRDDTATIFCGGPIWSLAWAPTPVDMEVDQILAVSIQKNPDKTYKMSQCYSGQEMIQFWNFGVLKNTKQLNALPSLEFCLLHDHGMIWHMEWCASGCYDEEEPEDSTELRRLGLLAVACSDGNIVIYSVHLPNNVKDSNGPNMVKPKEMYKLIVQTPSEQRLGLWDYQATKLSWTKAAGHSIVAGGYSNGMVCLFDLKTESPICKSEEDNVTYLTPYLTFHPHCAVITALCLHPLDGGGRWLVTGSWDRCCKYWDLNNISAPITAFLKRGLITDGVWMTHWLSSFLTYDDVFNLSHTVTTIQNVRDYSYKQTSALATNSMITAISANDWANAVAQGSLAGELTGSFPRQLLVSFDVDKGLKCKRLIFGYTELVEKNVEPAERMKRIKKKNNKKDVDFSDKDDKYIFKYFMNKDKEEFEQEPETYEDAQNKYALVFCDFKLDSYSQIPTEALSWVRQSSRMHEAPLELYPLMSINRVQWNPNKQAYLYLATGHQTGFLRLKCLRFMNSK